MKNEIGRKTTSLLLSIIMVAGGLTFAIPGEMPDAHAATENLFVSAENSMFDNSFAGPMVIEVVVNDPDLKEIDEAESEPDVTVNGQDLRMVQATDGNWYAYFADVDMALAADSQSLVNGTSLDFGVACAASAAVGVGYSDTDGVFFQRNVTGGDIRGGTLGTCADIAASGLSGPDLMNVVRENKTAAREGGGISLGQIGVAANEFPAIQLFDFTVDGTVEVKYAGSGPIQQIDLTYLDDADEYASMELDRTSYPRNSAVHMVVTDLMLNIDPTDEDSWTFSTNATQGTNYDSGIATTINGTESFYQVFNENGQFPVAPAPGNVVALDMGALNFDDNGVLILDPNADNACCHVVEGGLANVLALVDNDDALLFNDTTPGPINGGDNRIEIAEISSERIFGFLGPGTMPVTLTETQANSGIFKNTDEGDTANIKVAELAIRGTTATIDYNDSAVSILVQFDTAELHIHEDAIDGTWNSGELVEVELHDMDTNQNSLIDEHYDLFEDHVINMPVVQIGEPFMPTPHCEQTDVTTDPDGDGQPGGRGDLCAFPAHAGFQDVILVNETASNVLRAGFVTNNLFHHTEIHDVDHLLRGHYHQFPTDTVDAGFLNVTYSGRTMDELGDFFDNQTSGAFRSYFNYDIRTFDNFTRGILAADGITLTDKNFDTLDAIWLQNGTGAKAIDLLNGQQTNSTQDLIDITDLVGTHNVRGTGEPEVAFDFQYNITCVPGTCVGAGFEDRYAVFAADFFRFGITGDGVAQTDRYNDVMYRLELHETGDNTGDFHGTMEYVMMNQILINDTSSILDRIETIDEDVVILIHDDQTDEDSVRVNYDDLGRDGVFTNVGDQIEAPTHSGVVSFDSSSYKIADTVVITLEDSDLNTDVELIDVFTVVGTADSVAQRSSWCCRLR